MHRPLRGRAVALASTLLAAGVLHASPTPNEFQACHQLGAKLLQHCLDQAPGRLEEACWRQSRERTSGCYADVRNAGTRERERAEAARRAQQRANRPDPAASGPGTR